jgi:methyl-accepting chemotaxis protein
MPSASKNGKSNLFSRWFKRFLYSKKLRTQLLIGFGLTLFIAVASITVVSSVVTMNNLEDDTKSTLDGYTDTLVSQTSVVVDDEVANVHSWVEMPGVKTTATDASVLDPLTELWPTYEGEKWGDDSDLNGAGIEPRAESDINIDNDLNPEIGKYFVTLVSDHPYAEIFITDARGYAIASSGNTGDFMQGDEGWWQNAKTDGLYISDFEYDDSSRTWSMSISVSIEVNSTFAGVMKAQYTFDSLYSILDDFEFGSNGFPMVVSDTGDLIIYPDATFNPDDVAEGESRKTLSSYMNSKEAEVILTGVAVEKTLSIDGTSYYVDTNGIDFPDEYGLSWVAISLIPESEITNKVQEPIYYSVGVALISVLLLSLFAIFFSNMLARRINNIKNSSERIAEGDLSIYSEDETDKLSANGETDEIGQLQVNFVQMISQLREIVGATQESVGIMNNTSEDLFSGAEEINASAEEVASTSQAMSDGATSQTELITEVTTDIFDTTKMVDDIISKIQGNTEEVAQIALQTNILALNAGIEASRAGDYGRGFAVVAENVRKLSDQSKNASDQIALVAMEISDKLKGAFDKISITMSNIVSVSEETAASAEEVAAAAEEMTATIEELSSAAQELTTHAENSGKMIGVFQV